LSIAPTLVKVLCFRYWGHPKPISLRCWQKEDLWIWRFNS